MRNIHLTIYVVFAVVILSGCFSSGASLKYFAAKEEIAKYNGQNGNPAYIIVDDVIYDVSKSPAWKDGSHKGMNAGQDVSEAIKKDSPHKLDVLKDLPIIGRILKQTFTKEELSKYNGLNGAKAYVAVDGIVYDVTDVGAWKGGEHKGYKAGQDITEFIGKSFHGKGVVTKRTAVGRLIQ